MQSCATASTSARCHATLASGRASIRRPVASCVPVAFASFGDGRIDVVQPLQAQRAGCTQTVLLCSKHKLRQGTLTVRRSRAASLVTRAQGGEGDVPKNTEFGYSRKDIILIGVGIIAFGYLLYYGLQATGLEPGLAGNWVQLLVFVGICIGWVGSYIYRVATKQMTYVKQLEQYEDAVMRKRVEEMTEEELQSMLGEAAADNEARQQQLAARKQKDRK